MRDATTDRPMKVRTDGTAGPYIIVPLEQLEPVKRLLVQHQVYFWADEDAVSVDDKPELAIINLGRNVDATAVQALLDQQP
jgi:hypothetical protein